MGVRAINYCVETVDAIGLEIFKAIQVIVGFEGDPKTWTNLRKHGHDGGVCRQWRLQAGDYIRNVQYTWD